MEKYDYKKAIIQDIKQYIKDNHWVENCYDNDKDYYENLDILYDEVWAEDSITGNGFNYYDTEKKCQEYIASNLALYFQAANDFCDFPNDGTPWIYKNPAQHMDATIRCYLLRECLEEACEEM